MAIIGINFAVTGGLLTFSLGLLLFLFPTMGTSPEFLVPHNQDLYLPYNQITGTFDLLSGSVNFLAMVIIVPLYEEFLYRGIALRAYEKVRSPLFAAAFTAVLFSLFHINWIKFIFFIPSSFITARAVQIFGSWWIAVIVHTVYNGFIFLLNSFTFTNETVTDNPISLMRSFLGLIIALVAFGLAMYWFNTHAQKTLVIDKKTDRVFTPSLTIFAIICFLLMMK